MGLNTFIISRSSASSTIEDFGRLRGGGPAPKHSEVLTVEIVGELLGFDPDKGI